MKKMFLGILLAAVGVVSVGLSTDEVKADEMVFDQVERTQNFVDPALVGTKVDVSTYVTSGSQPLTGGHLYKNGRITSHTVTSRTYVGVVTKANTTWFTLSIEGTFKWGALKAEIGYQYSSTKQAKRYNVTGTSKATFDVYDKYSGNYMYSTSLSGNFSGREDIAI